ncbi:hypothetical protein ACFYQQ_10495 [Streptomyces sp. NPDC005496]|uniref:hypothetical protein n=1 Tax=unclassified Streptomyces TaxID=2593676 RepID=UPI0033AD39DE
MHQGLHGVDGTPTAHGTLRHTEAPTEPGVAAHSGAAFGSGTRRGFGAHSDSGVPV